MRKLVPLKSIYAFVAVTEMGSMTAAANALNVSHSAVSQSIKSLENMLGKSLFERIGRQVRLNTDGKRYYRKVAPALEQIVDATEAMAQPNHSSRMTLNMVNSLALHWWIPKVDEFQRYAPQLDVRISNLVGAFNLEQQGVDVALIHGLADDWHQYHCEKLADDKLVMVCSPELIKRTGSDEPQQLLAQSAAIMVSNDRRKHDWQLWCAQHQLPLPSHYNNLNFNISVQAVQATARHLGVLVTHRMFVRDEIKYGQLQEVGNAVVNPMQSFYFVCAKSKLTEESVVLLRSWLKREFETS